MKIQTLKNGFSLLELVVVVSVLAILAGLIVPRMGKVSDKAKFSRAAADLKSMQRSIELMHQDLGFYPSDVGSNTDPGLNDLNRVPTAQRSKWSGPYLEAWPSTHPWGGNFDYEYWNYANFNFDGPAGNEVLISMRNGMNAEIMDEIDARLDDGNRNTGMVRHNGSNWLGYYVGEGPKW